MAWLHDNGDENEYSQFEEDEGGEGKDEGVLEEAEEEVVITERPGITEAPVSTPQPKPRRPRAAKARRKPARAKAGSKKKKKSAAKSSRKRSARKSSRSRKKR